MLPSKKNKAQKLFTINHFLCDSVSFFIKDQTTRRDEIIATEYKKSSVLLQTFNWTLAPQRELRFTKEELP